MRVFVATPAYNSQVSTSYMGSVLSLPQAGVAVEWLSADDSLVSRARNTLVAKFLESRAEPLLFSPGQSLYYSSMRISDSIRYRLSPCSILARSSSPASRP